MPDLPSPEPVFLHIVDHRSPALWRNRIYSALVPIVLIGIGALLESAAMQWAGFLLTCFLALAVAFRANKDRLTIDQARDRLNEIERDQ
ncbi:MAG: hypothetical protein AB3N24_13115 [Leisingera sp.]